jgi:hypothetical protein
LENYNSVCPNTPNSVNNIKLWPTKNNKRINDDNNEVVKCTSIHNSLEIQNKCHSRNLQLDVLNGGFITTNWNEYSLLHNRGSLLQKYIIHGCGCYSPPIGICLLFLWSVGNLQKIKKSLSRVMALPCLSKWKVATNWTFLFLFFFPFIKHQIHDRLWTLISINLFLFLLLAIIIF